MEGGADANDAAADDNDVGARGKGCRGKLRGSMEAIQAFWHAFRHARNALVLLCHKRWLKAGRVETAWQHGHR
jgi:hypothetical protein